MIAGHECSCVGQVDAQLSAVWSNAWWSRETACRCGDVNTSVWLPDAGYGGTNNKWPLLLKTNGFISRWGGEWSVKLPYACRWLWYLMHPLLRSAFGWRAGWHINMKIDDLDMLGISMRVLEITPKQKQYIRCAWLINIPWLWVFQPGWHISKYPPMTKRSDISCQ